MLKGQISTSKRRGLRNGKLTLNRTRLEAKLVLLGDAGHRTLAELAGPSSNAATAVAIAAGRGARDIDVGSGNLQLDIRDEELAFGSLLQDGDFLLLNDGGNGGWQ